MVAYVIKERFSVYAGLVALSQHIEKRQSISQQPAL